MSRTRRKGIEYTPQFGGGIFRPQEVVQEERASVAMQEDLAGTGDPPAALPAVEGMPSPPVSASATQEVERSTSEQVSNYTSVLASYHTGTLAAIRQVVRKPGREVSFVRLSPEEKGQLADIVYTYKRQGKKTSETEINRIAINYLLADYHAHGEQSLLARMLDALQA